jgi:exopolysaccharide production protein ExoQ
MYTSIFAPRTSQRRPFFAGLEFALVALLLCVFTRVALPSLAVGIPEEFFSGTQGDGFFLQLFYYGCYMLSIVLMARYMMPMAALLFARPVMLIFIGYIIALSLTSSAPAYSLSAAIEYGFATLFGTYIAVRFSYEEYVRMLCIIFTSILVISFVFVVIFPDIGLQKIGNDYAIRGAFQNRNTLAYFMSLGAPLLLLYGSSKLSRFSALYILAGVAALLLIYTSYALTAKITVSVSLLLIGGLLWARNTHFRRVIVWFLACYIGIFVIALLTLYYHDILAAFGKDPTLTGRVEYFALALNEILASPIFGTHGAPLYVEFLGVENVPANAFSGHLNMLMFYGATGLLIYMLLIIHHAIGAVAFLNRWPSATRLWPIVFLCFWVLGNITEAATLGVFFWTLFSAHLIGFRTWYSQSST